jgi:hypothetical protein
LISTQQFEFKLSWSFFFGLKAMATHFSCYCPLAEDCSSKGRMKWWGSEQEAREYVFNHLKTSTYHGEEKGITEDLAKELADGADLDTWGPSEGDKSTAGKRKRDTAPSPDAGRASASASGSADSGKAAGKSKKGGQTVAEAYAQRRELVAALDRAEGAEQSLEQLHGIMTRAVEQLTRSAAAIKTAARFARQAADAFEAEHHNVSSALECIQSLYSPPSTASTSVSVVNLQLSNR